MLTGKTLCMAHGKGHSTVHLVELAGRGNIVTLCNGRTTSGLLEPEGTAPTCKLCLKKLAKEGA